MNEPPSKKTAASTKMPAHPLIQTLGGLSIACSAAVVPVAFPMVSLCLHFWTQYHFAVCAFAFMNAVLPRSGAQNAKGEGEGKKGKVRGEIEGWKKKGKTRFSVAFALYPAAAL